MKLLQKLRNMEFSITSCTETGGKHCSENSLNMIFFLMNQAPPLPVATQGEVHGWDLCCPARVTMLTGAVVLHVIPLTFFYDRGLDVFMSRFMDVNETLGILYLIFLIQG